MELRQVLKHKVLIASLVFVSFAAASAATATSQTTAKPATSAAAKPAAAAPKSTSTAGVKTPAGVPPAKGIVKTAFALRYVDIKFGAGALAEPNKLYKVHYTLWLGANGRPDDGTKVDSSYDRRTPIVDKDGKPVLDADKKPKMSDPHPEPFSFPQGYGRLIPGWDQGFAGMRIGGKRRLYVPWQLAYGAAGRPGPDAAHPGIPPKGDLIFDVELLDVTDLPTPPNHGPMPAMRPTPGGAAPKPGAQGPASAPGKPTIQISPGTSAAPATPKPGSQPQSTAPTAPSASPTSPANTPKTPPAASATAPTTTPTPAATTTTPQPK